MHAIIKIPRGHLLLALCCGGFTTNACLGQSASVFYPVAPCRVADTRGNGFTGSFGPPTMPAGYTRSFPIPSGNCGVPSSAQAYSLNLTVVPPGPLTYLTAWPTGQPQPTVSTLNSLDGRIVANAAIVPAGSGGAISLYVTDTTDVIIDINGYFASPGTAGLAFYPVAPCRLADTRGNGFTGVFGPPTMPAQSTRTFPISGSCGAPSTAQAYSLTITAAPPAPLLYLTAWPAGQPQPLVSTLNSSDAAMVANAALVPAPTNGSGAVSIFVSGTTDVIIDVDDTSRRPDPAGSRSLPRHHAALPIRATASDSRGLSGRQPWLQE